MNKPVSFLPAYAGIGDGFAVAMLRILLIAVLYVALNHETLDQLPDTLRGITAVQHVLTDTYLLNVFLARIGMVAVYDNRRIGKLLLLIELIKP